MNGLGKKRNGWCIGYYIYIYLSHGVFFGGGVGLRGGLDGWMAGWLWSHFFLSFFPFSFSFAGFVAAPDDKVNERKILGIRIAAKMSISSKWVCVCFWGFFGASTLT